MTLFWLSFADENRKPGKQLLGVVIVRGTDFQDAVEQAWLLGCNPGGQVVGLPVPGTLTIDKRYIERLLTRQEAEVVDAEMKKQRARHAS
jgi:pseudouridine-5'-phosphate glycosidase